MGGTEKAQSFWTLSPQMRTGLPLSTRVLLSIRYNGASLVSSTFQRSARSF